MPDTDKLPPIEAGGTINLETKPRQVKAWLSDLESSDPVAGAVLLLKFLAACNHSELPEDRRHQLLDLVEPVVSKIRGALRWQYLKSPPPLDVARQSQADLASALLTEIAETYQLLISANLDRSFRLFGGDPLPGLIRKRIGWLYQGLVHHFEIHAAVPEGLWLALHQCYTLGVRLGHADAADGVGISATDLYRSALLLAIADPYRMPDHEVPWALDLIGRHGRLAQLIPASATNLRPGSFALDHHRDSPPYALARGHDPLLQTWSFSLSTMELVKFLTWLLNYLGSAKAQLDPDLAPNLGDPRYPAFLQRLKRQWSASVQRLQQRRQTEHPLDHQIISGFAALTAALAGENATELAPSAATMPAHCQATNVSAGGMTLNKVGDLEMPLQVGELVGLRPDSRSPWQAGIVRWLRSPAQGEVGFGVQFLPPHARLVQLLPARADAGSPALLLCTQPGPAEGGLLVAKAGAIDARAALAIRIEGQARPIKMEKAVDLGPGLDAWRISLAG